jgi:hypothetical protein
VNAFLWHVEENVLHHIRAGSVDEARERIAVTHGQDVARRAVIKSLETTARGMSESSAA